MEDLNLELLKLKSGSVIEVLLQIVGALTLALAFTRVPTLLMKYPTARPNCCIWTDRQTREIHSPYADFSPSVDCHWSGLPFCPWPPTHFFSLPKADNCHPWLPGAPLQPQYTGTAGADSGCSGATAVSLRGALVQGRSPVAAASAAVAEEVVVGLEREKKEAWNGTKQALSPGLRREIKKSQYLWVQKTIKFVILAAVRAGQNIRIQSKALLTNHEPPTTAGQGHQTNETGQQSSLVPAFGAPFESDRRG